MEAGVSSPVAFRWFRPRWRRNPCLPPTVSGRYLSFSGARTSRCCEQGVSVCARSHGGSSGIRRRSHGSFVGTRRRGPGGSTTSPRSPSGTPSGLPPAEGRKARRERAASRLRAGAARRDRSSTRRARRRAGRSGVEGSQQAHRKDRRWVRAWSPQQIANRLRLDFPMMSRCGSVTRRSIRRSTSRAEGR